MLVENDFIALGFFDGFQSFGAGVPFDLVWIVYSDDSRLVEGCSDFVDDVCFQVQLGLPLRAEGETAYLISHISVFGSVPVILVTCCNKLDGVVPGFPFAGEFAGGGVLTSSRGGCGYPTL